MKQDETTNRREPKKASKAHIAAKPQTIEHTGIRVYQQVRDTIKMQKICKVREEYLTQHETKNYQEPMSLFCVGHSLLDMGPALRNSFYSRKTTLEKSAFSLVSGNQLQIAFDLGIGLVSTSPLSVAPSGADVCRSCRKLIAEFTKQKYVSNLIIHL